MFWVVSSSDEVGTNLSDEVGLSSVFFPGGGHYPENSSLEQCDFVGRGHKSMMHNNELSYGNVGYVWM